VLRPTWWWIGSTRIALPSWADRRAIQMEEIAERIPRLLDEQSRDF
jgi:hypothetical protein